VRARRLSLDLPDWPGHRPGQHVDLRLTAEDGYTAQRSYSIASAPEQPGIDLVIERLPDGEVSPYLTDELRVGDLLEVRGPIGGYFVWPEGGDRPVQLIAGGSGVVPLLAMLAHHRVTGSTVPVRLLYSARSDDDIIGRTELDQPGPAATVTITLTRTAPAGWTGSTGRVDAALLAERTIRPEQEPDVLVCGPTSFVEAVATELLMLGHDPARVKTERFGATGGS
jgi:ferredoxin-NADP reductase